MTLNFICFILIFSLEKWPKTNSGYPSTAGTTATIAFVRRNKLFIGHVGDSGIVLGYQKKGNHLIRGLYIFFFNIVMLKISI